MPGMECSKAWHAVEYPVQMIGLLQSLGQLGMYQSHAVQTHHLGVGLRLVMGNKGLSTKQGVWMLYRGRCLIILK